MELPIKVWLFMAKSYQPELIITSYKLKENPNHVKTT